MEENVRQNEPKSLSSTCRFNTFSEVITPKITSIDNLNPYTMVLRIHLQPSECSPGGVLHKKFIFSLAISSVNVSKSAGNCGFGHIY